MEDFIFSTFLHLPLKALATRSGGVEGGGGGVPLKGNSTPPSVPQVPTPYHQHRARGGWIWIETEQNQDRTSDLAELKEQPELTEFQDSKLAQANATQGQEQEQMTHTPTDLELLLSHTHRTLDLEADFKPDLGDHHSWRLHKGWQIDILINEDGWRCHAFSLKCPACQKYSGSWQDGFTPLVEAFTSAIERIDRTGAKPSRADEIRRRLVKHGWRLRSGAANTLMAEAGLDVTWSIRPYHVASFSDQARIAS